MDTFNDKFGHSSDDGRTHMDDRGDLVNTSANMDNPDLQNHFTTYSDTEGDDLPVRAMKRHKSGSYYDERNVKRPFTSSKPHARAMQKASDEYNAWRNDEYTYNKGQGYHNTNNKTDWHDYLDYNNR